MNHLTAQDAREIFLQALPELSEPLKSAVGFALANWHKLNREPRPSDIAINFFASLPALPKNEVDKVFAAKLNNMAKLLRDDPDVWLSLENLPHEQWRDVVGYEGLYKVSNFGRVKSLYFKGGRILRGNGLYPVVCLAKNGEISHCGIHILVAEAFAPNPRNLPVVHHADDTKINSCVWNLAWVTRSENTKLAYQSGAMKKRHGYKNFNARLTPEQVRYIRKNYKACDKKFGVKALAIKFNVNVSTIADVIRLRTYKNIN